MEARTSPRRRIPSRRLLSAFAADRVDDGRVTKTTFTPRRTSQAGSAGSHRSKTVTPSSHKTKGRRTRTAPSTTRTAIDNINTASPSTETVDQASLASGPAQAGSKLNVRRTRPAAGSSRNNRRNSAPLSADEDYYAPSTNSGAPLISPEMEALLVRGSVISPTNAVKVMVRGQMRPNPFFETMPAPAVIRQGVPRLFLAGETTDMQQHIGQQIKYKLLKEDDRGQKPVTKQPPGFFSRFFDQASNTLGFGKTRKGGDNVVRVNLPEPWVLPSITEAEVIGLVHTLPRDAATVQWAR